MRNTNETDDINSILKSPCIKARKKRRKRSSWASGVIKKAKRATTPRNGTDNENGENVKSDEEEQVGYYHIFKRFKTFLRLPKVFNFHYNNFPNDFNKIIF